MNALGATELSRIRSAASDTFRDSCKLGTATEDTSGAFPVPTESWDASERACGFDAGGGADIRTTSRESVNGAQAAVNEARLRLPLDASVTNVSRVRLTKKNGTALSPEQDFHIVGAPARGISALILRLVALPGESAA